MDKKQIEQLKKIGRWDETHQRPRIINKLPLHNLENELFNVSQKLRNNKYDTKLQKYQIELQEYMNYYVTWDFYTRKNQ